jgi:hypothetical protein
MEEVEIDGASSMHGSNEESYKIWPENLKGRDCLEGLGIHRRIMLKCVFKK